MSRNKNKDLLCGVITKRQQIKAMKIRSAEVHMPKSGYYMTEKDRPRNKNWRNWKE